jgi:hypothetical protein
MTKSDYISMLLFGRHPFKQLSEAAIIFWHSEVPPLNAKIYIERLENKLLLKLND